MSKKNGKYGTDGVRNNQAMPELPKEQWDHGATDGIDEVVEGIMDELEETFTGEKADKKSSR